MIFDKIEKSFAAQREKPMIQFENNALYFDGYVAMKKYIMDELANAGIQKRCCTALKISRSHIGFLLAAYLRRMDAIVLMLDSKMSGYELQSNLQAYKPDILITDDEQADQADLPADYYKENNVMSQLVLGSKLQLFRRNCESNWGSIANQDKLKGSFVFFTSGTTKIPKAAIRTGANIFEDAVNNIEYFSITSADKVLCAASFSHVYGFGSGCIPYLAAGATVKFINPASTFGILKRELLSNSYTVFVGVPIHYFMLASNLEKPLNLRLALTAGSAPDTNLVDSLHEKLGLHLNNMYGSTELGGISTLYQDINPDNKYSVGKPLSNVSVKMGKLIQKEDSGQSLYEVHVKSKALSPGYYNHEDGCFYGIELCDGWFNTKDIGYMIGDDLYVVCRNENMINCSGKKMNPVEIESVLLRYPNIKEAVVVGKSDEKQGEIPVAYVVSDINLDKQAVVHFCYDKLPIHKVPREIIQIAQLPKTKMGKLLRNKLKG